MKHKITVAICVIILVVVGVFVYQSAHNGSIQRVVAAGRAQAAIYYKQHVAAEAVAAEKQRLATQCQVQTKFWSALPASSQAKVAKPQCDLQQVE